MTVVVNHETGEVADTIGETEARRLTTEAKNELASAATHHARGWDLIEEAVNGGGHLDLGYQSPSHYLHAEFDGVLAGLDVATRRVAVRAMTGWGVSVRSIASPLGIGKSTVQRDQVSHVGHLNQPPEGGDSASGEDDPTAVEATSGDNRPQDYPAAPPPARPPVIGIDGKTYAAPAPKQPKPVLDGNAAEYDNAAQGSLALARAVTKLLQFQHPTMRAAMRRNWSMASAEVPPTPRRDVTPEQMRVAAHGLLALADEWETP